MLSFYPSIAHTHSYAPLYSARSRYSDDDVVCLHPYSPFPRTTHHESRYRRALSEYLAAEEELRRARQEATLRVLAEALRRRQEEARLLRSRTIRAREERQVQQLKQLLAQRCAIPLAAQTASPEVHISLPHVVPVAYCAPERRENPKTRISFMGGNQPVNGENQPEHQTPNLVPENEAPAPNLESILQARLHKVASDNKDQEMQDLARATLQHLVQHTSDTNDTATSSSETTLDSVTPLPGATDLERSDALQGTAAEAAKASFKAHREAVAEQVSKDSAALETIQDIHANLSKLSSDFSIPPSLDFSDDEADGLAYTPMNAPIRVYEHALEGLLAQLDAVESDGHEEVRVARKSVVKEVERALEDVETKIRRAREVVKDNGVAEENTVRHVETETETQTAEDLASILGHSSLAPVSAPVVDGASDFVEIVPDNSSAIEDTSVEESTKVVTEPTSLSSPAAMKDEGPASTSSNIAIGEPEDEDADAVPLTSETHEDAVSVFQEGFILTSTPGSPVIPSPTLPDDAPASRVSGLPTSEGGPGYADDEDGWSEVEA